MDKREKAIELSLNAKSFIQSRLGVEVEVYLSEFNGFFQIQEVQVGNDLPSKRMLIPEKNAQK